MCLKRETEPALSALPDAAKRLLLSRLELSK
jgi:hypothetical protein